MQNDFGANFTDKEFGYPRMKLQCNTYQVHNQQVKKNISNQAVFKTYTRI